MSTYFNLFWQNNGGFWYTFVVKVHRSLHIYPRWNVRHANGHSKGNVSSVLCLNVLIIVHKMLMCLVCLHIHNTYCVLEDLLITYVNNISTYLIKTYSTKSVLG